MGHHFVDYYLVGGWATPLKNMSSSVGMISNPIYAKVKNGNQTTNQYNHDTHMTYMYIYI